MRAPLLALLALCVASLVPGSLGDIVSDSLDHDARSIVLVARPFGFEANGMVDVKVSNWRVYLEAGRPKYDPQKIGFFITTAEAEVQLQQDLAAGACRSLCLAREGCAHCRPWRCAHAPGDTPLRLATRTSAASPAWTAARGWPCGESRVPRLPIGFDTWALPGARPAAPSC